MGIGKTKPTMSNLDVIFSLSFNFILIYSDQTTVSLPYLLHVDD